MLSANCELLGRQESCAALDTSILEYCWFEDSRDAGRGINGWKQWMSGLVVRQHAGIYKGQSGDVVDL